MQDAIRTDLTGYAALIGESFQSRVDLLEKLLQDRHYPSLGRYKERLLAETIRNFLPSTVEVGTGFVLFPHADDAPVAGGAYHDPLNQSAYVVSRQCDIIVYDITTHPPVFRDGNFVVVRPESVKSIIEVKGSLGRQELLTTLAAFLDFGKKWQRTQRFYTEHHHKTARSPQLHCFAWKLRSGKTNRPLVSPASLRNLVAKFYSEQLKFADLGAFPLLTSLMIYNECEISDMHNLVQGDNEFISQIGWHSRNGKFIRLNPDGSPFADRDRTVSSLLAKLHWAINREEFNRFFSYTDEVKDDRVVTYPHRGFSCAWESSDVAALRRINTDQLPEIPTGDSP